MRSKPINHTPPAVSTSVAAFRFRPRRPFMKARKLYDEINPLLFNLLVVMVFITAVEGKLGH